MTASQYLPRVLWAAEGQNSQDMEKTVDGTKLSFPFESRLLLRCKSAIQIYTNIFGQHTYTYGYVCYIWGSKGKNRVRVDMKEVAITQVKNQSEYEVQTGLHKNRHLSTQAVVTGKAFNTLRHSGGKAGHERSHTSRCPQSPTAAPFEYETRKETCCFKHALGALTLQIKERC